MRTHFTVAAVALVLVALAAPAAVADSTPFLAAAVVQVTHETAYAGQLLSDHGQLAQPGFLASVAAMNYVVGHATAPAYGYNQSNGTVAATAAEQILDQQAAICGGAALTFAAIMQQVGYPVRSVQFFYPGGGHIADEVFYGGSWHYFDPTWGIYFPVAGDALSIAQAWKDKSRASHAAADTALLWRAVASRAGLTTATGLNVYTRPNVKVVVGQQPF